MVTVRGESEECISHRQEVENRGISWPIKRADALQIKKKQTWQWFIVVHHRWVSAGAHRELPASEHEHVTAVLPADSAGARLPAAEVRAARGHQGRQHPATRAVDGPRARRLRAFSATSAGQSFRISRSVITTRKRSLRRLCFYTCLSVHGGGLQVHTQGEVEGSGWG